jgi:NAD(P)-dependent dehydrogenase (short-subunit alcohol dehydrogenase family)
MKNGRPAALITGSGRNMGRGCAKELAAAGFNIVVNGSRDKAACERVADEVRTIGTDATVVMVDIGDQSAVTPGSAPTPGRNKLIPETNQYCGASGGSFATYLICIMHRLEAAITVIFRRPEARLPLSRATNSGRPAN